ncbi:unnamed protein product [Ambrosiozyma monospora]|uniref:Unnamed protein product n=1 Tax=Ambrosiozyma monospora TaxID=43982 RepID=A0A9W6YVE9_AMBMO|nr:unnamed protein product [Ambrosiozyma monospora]
MLHNQLQWLDLLDHHTRRNAQPWFLSTDVIIWPEDRGKVVRLQGSQAPLLEPSSNCHPACSGLLLQSKFFIKFMRELTESPDFQDVVSFQRATSSLKEHKPSNYNESQQLYTEFQL